jgi:hypothetical protein
LFALLRFLFTFFVLWVEEEEEEDEEGGRQRRRGR